MVTRVCPLLQPDPLSAFLHPFWARANKCLIEAKSRTVVEIQHLLPPPRPPHPLTHPPPRTERRLLCSNILIMNLKSVAVVVFQSKDLTGGESERGREREGETERGRGSARGRAKGKTGDCSFSLLIRAPTPTGFSSTKDPERKWANPAKLEGENRLRRLSRTPLHSSPFPLHLYLL